MGSLSLKNWGPLGDFIMVVLLFAFLLAAGTSHGDLVSSGPFSIVFGVEHLNHDISGYLVLSLMTLGIYSWVAHDLGSFGGVRIIARGTVLKESLPFSKSRGYGVWQGVYYNAFGLFLTSVPINLVASIYAASPGTFPSDGISAWIHAYTFPSTVFLQLGSTGGTSFILAFIAWFIIRPFFKKSLLRVGLIYTKKWYNETESEASMREALQEVADRQADMFIRGWMWWS